MLIKLNNLFKYKKEMIIGIILALIIIIFSEQYFLLVNIPSESMENTLKVGDRVYVSKDFNIEPGKIYVFKKDIIMIKRCIAIEGDRVVITNNSIEVNGNKLKENYVSSKNSDDIILDVIVPKESIFFLGDNRAESFDARYWDERFVPIKDILGEAKYIIYPIKRIRKIY